MDMCIYFILLFLILSNTRKSQKEECGSNNSNNTNRGRKYQSVTFVVKDKIIYIYSCVEREREREKKKKRQGREE